MSKSVSAAIRQVCSDLLAKSEAFTLDQAVSKVAEALHREASEALKQRVMNYLGDLSSGYRGCQVDMSVGGAENPGIWFRRPV